MGRPLHSSEGKTLLACPAKWGHAYRSRRVPVATSDALTRGTAVHVWLALWWAGQTSIALPEDPIARACCIGYAAFYGAPDLANVRVEVPWQATIGGVACAGTLDAHGTGMGTGPSSEPDAALVIVEHKTTSQAIEPGSLYWRQVVTTDPQVSMYRAAFPRAKILYDVIRKPALSHLRKGKPNEETDEELVARCVEAMVAEPARYFQRAYVVRLEAEDAQFAADVQAIDAMRRLPTLPRNPASCFAFGSRCGYFEVCWEGASLDDGALFRDQDPER